MRPHGKQRAFRAVFLVAMGLAFVGAAWGQNIRSLKSVGVPKPPGLERYVRDQDMLVALSKALFWDMQAGSDGRTACATCHFHAGAEHRAQNQLAEPQGRFRPNHLLSIQDFPFRLLANVTDNRSAVLRDSAQRAGSAGVFRRIFIDVLPGGAADDGFDIGDAPEFSLDGISVRQVTGRNTPTVINAVFNVRNFWDGRASNVFTGLTPFGESDTRRNALVDRDGRLEVEPVRIENASLASQAVGPPMSDEEMSYEGRNWPKFGKKMLGLGALARQRLASDDSVLGPLSNAEGRGLAEGLTYLALVQFAFQPEYWQSSQLVDSEGNRLQGRTGAPRGANEFTQAELNFALFWGLAVQAYESTLVSDDSRFDRFAEGAEALTPMEQQGLRIFQGTGRCDTCHRGAEFTTASFTELERQGPVRTIGGRNGAVTDNGFFRIGVRPIMEDVGLGGEDAFGRPLAVAAALRPGSPLAAGGAFKTPGLRNVELTGPYFHNGGQGTLEQVVEFYTRGGDFPGDGNLGPGIGRRPLSPEDRQAVVAFLKALTDDRVRYERAPFDHPELCVPVGHEEIRPGVLLLDGSDTRFSLSAAERWALIPAVGREGNPVPLQTFEELLQGIGADGTRAHTLTDPCPVD